MGRTILIVDDSKLEREMLSAYLKDEYDILTASDGREAMDILRRKSEIISAVVLELVMPVMDGFEILKEIRRDLSLRSIPVIIYTALDDEKSHERAIELGADGFMAKPCSHALLIHTLQNVIRLKETSAMLNTFRRDKLTGILNREAFFREAERLIHSHAPGYYVLSCFDVDNFKLINDRFGVEKGDMVLKHIASCISGFVDGLNGLTCRFTADRFAILYPASRMLSEEVTQNHAEAMSPKCVSCAVRIRIGRYIVDDLSLSVSAMYDRATLAQESIKGKYGSYIAYYDSSMRQQLILEQSIVSRMSDALKNGEFEPWFQPQYNHLTGAMIGAEALVRWKRDGTVVPPNDFVPIFESSGFIYEMDKYLWRQVCVLLRRWLDEGASPPPVSVNVSRYDVFQEDFLSVISGLMEEYRLPVELLRLEITESAFSESTKTIIHSVRELIKRGFTVEIDDFGSGYSSLNTLKDVPASIFKLDMRFLESTEDSVRGGTILESVVRMAKWLGMAVIAEGVEEQAQADFLKSIGCYYIQGYYYSRPIPVSEYEALLAASPLEPKLSRLKTLENLDNNEFWNPKSMETLIFNSYVGGACIFEYHNGRSEILRYNDSYARIFTGSFAYDFFTGFDSLVHLDDENRALLISNIERAIELKKESSCELRLSGAEGDVKYLRVTLRQLAQTKDRHLMYCVLLDMTDQRKAEKESEEQLRFLNNCAHDILAQPDSGRAIDCTLRRLLDYFSAGRAYILESDNQNLVSNNTYEVCAEGVTSEKDSLQGIPFSVSASWFDPQKANEPLGIADVEKLDDSEEELKQLLLRQGISSIIVAPLWRDGELIGYVGVDNPKRGIHQLDRLMAIGDYLAILLTRRDLSLRIQQSNDEARQLMDDTPGGFMRIDIRSGPAPKIVSMNDGFCRMLGMSREDIMEAYGSDAYKCVSREDVAYAQSNGNISARDQFSAKCRLRRGDGSLLWVMVFGRFVNDEGGRTFLNAYFSDITEEKRAEEQQKELLDNLPCGAALYEFDGKALSVIHINKSYWQLVGREPADYIGDSVLGAIHADDRSIVYQEIDAAIRQNRNIKVSIRILCGDGEYRPFLINAKLMPEKNGKQLFFAAYTPVSDRTMSVQEVIPIALSTMMSASADISYIKDRDMHYICCSASAAKAAGLESARDIIGKTDFDLFDSELAEKYYSEDKKVVESGESLIDFIETLPPVGGHARLAMTSKYPITDAFGDVVGLCGISRDVTAQRERESQLELLAGSIPGGLAAYSIDENGISMLYFNDGFFGFSGCTREDYAATVAKDPLAFVFEEDKAQLQRMVEGFKEHKVDGHVNGCVYRCHTKGGGYRWMSMKSVLSKRGEDSYVVNVVQIDITEQQEERERLRVSEEFNRLAIEQSGSIITRFDVRERTLTLPDSFNPIFVLPHVLNNMPEEQIDLGRVSPETADAYRNMFESIVGGSPLGSIAYQQNSTKGWRWLEAQYTTVFSSSGEPVSAVISFADITERLEKEVVYNKWQQSLTERAPDSYTLFRCNLSRGTSYDSWEGSLLSISFDETRNSFDERTAQYVEQCVFGDDRERYLSFLKSDTMLAEYYRGHRSDSIEYRELTPNGRTRWLRLSVDLVEYPNSRDIEVYLMFENIDEQKRLELLTLERSETDPLTGVLNRSAFISRLESVISSSEPGKIHALFMLDVDEFKRVNDTLGHGAGDHVLVSLTSHISSILRREDIIGRMGGDEFFVFLKDIPGREAAAKKAMEICSLGIDAGSSESAITTSIGIAMIPEDGSSFDTLYKKVDAALYREKKRGKDGYLFVSG